MVSPSYSPAILAPPPFSFISAWILMISFLLLIFWGEGVVLFPVVLGVKLGFLFDVFLVS